MDSIKSAFGYGAQSGQEPISGETGKGTTNEPYDSGNVAGQSGAPAAGATSTNPTGTTQYDTGTDTQTSKTAGDIKEPEKTSTSETLAGGVTSDDSTAATDAADAAADQKPIGSTSDQAAKGTDKTQGPDEQVTSSKYLTGYFART
ncbi:MAG: hypothetical protein Q9222_007660 [Ikaeria aurantiellina]